MSASPAGLAVAGAISLSAGMGIGRFAFTPILPMMLADGVVDLGAASWLASANYAGYLAGALLCMLAPGLAGRLSRPLAWPSTHLIRAGLLATGFLTLAMALPWPAAWPALRFAAGVASAVVFIYTSGWCLGQLARQDAAALGGAMYAGPGAGIVLSGLLASAMVAAQWRAAMAWVFFGLLAFALTATVWRVFRPEVASTAGDAPRSSTPPLASTAAASPRASGLEVGVLALAYGLAGFGYIITATFLPVIARQAIPGSALLDFFWPVFGLGVTAGALLASRLRTPGDLRLLLAASYVMQALGIGLNLWSPSVVGFAVGSLLLGLPFTAITFFALQEVRRLRPHAAASAIGLLTVLYGLGQIAGPALVGWVLRTSSSPAAGFTWSLQAAAAALLLGAGMYVVSSRAFPMR